MEPTESLARQLREQAGWCADLGSPLYAGLLATATRDVLARGPVWDVLAGHERDPRGSALGLRFLGAVHRLVLSGAAPALAAHYPSAGGTPGPGAEDAFLATVAAHVESLRDGVEEPVQTNEPGRSAPLLAGFLAVATRFGRPLRLLELGASAGLNLRFDEYRYESGDFRWGPDDSPLVLRDFLDPASAAPPAVAVTVAAREGCDERPVDPASPEGRLRLESFVWPDQVDRYERLRAALEVAAFVPARVDRADAGEWLPSRLADAAPGVATVVFHSVVWQYVPPESRRRIRDALAAAAGRATADAPLAYLRFEPGDDGFDLSLRCWPGGDDVVVATALPHGSAIRMRPAGRP